VQIASTRKNYMRVYSERDEGEKGERAKEMRDERAIYIYITPFSC
jgi:hypothetical protein